jgi:signal transduction histidine kinase
LRRTKLEKARILVADDEEYNLKLYSFNLNKNGYDVEAVENGQLAVDRALADPPDAILLDVMMPVMDGISACRLIKKDERTKDIPIIIVSAKNSVNDIVSGLKAGANEYLTKPFHVEELLLRVNSIVTLKKTHDELKNINLNLKEDVKKKTELLLEASRFEIIGKMASGLGHDLNNLLTGIVGYNRLAAEADDIELIKEFTNKQNLPLKLCQNFVKNLLNFSKVQKPILNIFDPRNAIDTTLGILSSRLNKNGMDYEVIEDEKTLIYGDEGQFNQVCLNIISNAIEALGRGGRITIDIKREGDYTKVSFADNGPGIKKDDIDKVFDYLYTTKGDKKSTGIGLYTTKKIVEGLKGKICLVSEEGKGAVFSISLPNSKKFS